MKDIIKTSERTEKFNQRELIAAGTTHIFSIAAGFIATRAAVADKLLPFGLSVVAGASLTYTPATAIGAFLGYFIPALDTGGFRYIAAMLAIVAIKLLLSGYKRLTERPVFLSFICLLASFLTSAVTFSGLNFSFLNVLAESLLAAGGTFFISRCCSSLPKAVSGLSVDELVSLFASLSIILTGINSFNFNGISLGHILGIALILTAGKYGGTISGAICGTTVALSLTISGTSGEIGVIYAFIGLISGVFASLGKYVQVAVPLIFSLTASIATGNPILIAATVIESALGSALFLALPRRLSVHISRLFSVYPKLVTPDGYKKSLSMKLNVAASALCDVSETVEQVSAELSKINSPDFSSVITAIEQDACAGCKLRIHCWESRRDSTVEAILGMTKVIKEGSRTPENGAPEEFRGRCLRVSQVANAAYKRYSDYTSRIAAENRIDEVRSVVSDQFDGISYMLTEFADDLEKDGKFDNSTAAKASSALKNLGIQTEECTCKIDKFGRMSLEMKVKKQPDTIINKLQIMKLLSVVCERDFDAPAVNRANDSTFITLCEHAAIRVDVGIAQKCASDSAMCGDAYKYFFDGRGHFIMILSDGMGTGGRAAVDGAMASGLMTRLIKAGFGYDCSLRILNSSMLFKSTDESLATVDIASIDLYTGNIELYKAGAAPTLIRRSGRTGKAVSTSLPAGILREISFDKAVVKCKIGDIVVLMSDGASVEGIDWIREEIENWSDGTAEELAERICESAKRRRADNHLDDISVMTAILKKSV
ncbi:MAG: SpoIIE family protein phosphatase [Acutalibacteraceae bacterium]|nr:SpoIIE family protein phosphatase [Acutalibacteraceae bacterium]